MHILCLSSVAAGFSLRGKRRNAARAVAHSGRGQAVCHITDILARLLTAQTSHRLSAGTLKLQLFYIMHAKTEARLKKAADHVGDRRKEA
jgi:hypothetical protein